MPESFNARFTRLRAAAGLTLEAMAAELGVTWQAVQQWERTKMPRRASLEGAARLLGVTPEYLLFGVGGDYLTDDERRVVALWRRATRQQRTATLRALRA